MDISMIFLFCLMSLVIGAVLMLIIQYYAFIRYFNLTPENVKEYEKANDEKYTLPENIMNNIKSNDPESKYPIVAINLIIQFLFYELKNTNQIRKWFYRKLSLELDELLAKTTTGKLFDKLTIRDLDLGAQFPEIRNLRVNHANLHDTDDHIENLDLVLELQYKGNFRVSIDADMVLGKKGSLTLRVKNLEGLARLQFTRKPYTHWSLSFLGDPKLDLHIESKFQGRQMQPNITFLINNQIRKAIRRKHTLPNYKLRYKPFFQKVEDDNDCDIIPNGKLNVKISELTRLLIPQHLTDIYCTLTMSSLAWVEARQEDDKNVIISLDIDIHKAKNQQIGIVFKQLDNYIQIEAVLPNTPAYKANLRSGDNLISIEGKLVTTISQVAKIIRNLIKPVFSLRIERIYPGIIRNDAILEDLELYESLSNINITFSKSTESVEIIQLTPAIQNSNFAALNLRKNSFEKAASETNLPTPSNSPRKLVTLFKNISRQASETDCNVIDNNEESNMNYNNNFEIESFQQHSTIDCPVNNFIEMNDLSQFTLNERCNYLNICVYGKCIGESILLGYVNVPINLVLAECSETSLGQYFKKYSLTPPHPQELKDHMLSSQNGFNSNMCFGDILVTFAWTGSTGLSPLHSALHSVSKKLKSFKSSIDKSDDEERPSDTKSHNFIRTHFYRATQCDYCGKKIWLKDAVQCRDCSMCCHKKCIIKCQQSTVCGPVDLGSAFALSKMTSAVSANSSQPEFTVTQPGINEDDLDEYEEMKYREECGSGRSSFSGLIAQGLKRVNSANNLAIPGIVSSLGQSSRSLPPTPQHTPRKQSLVNQSTNPFNIVTQRLEQIPDTILELTNDDIANITESLLGHPNDDIMNLAKTTSKNLYADLPVNERVDKINTLLSKLRIALDSETSTHATLLQTINNELCSTQKTYRDEKSPSSTLTIKPNTEPLQQQQLLLETKAPSASTLLLDISNDTNHYIEEMARKSLLLAQSEERVQALSVIMLYLCTGLQHAQGVAFN